MQTSSNIFLILKSSFLGMAVVTFGSSMLFCSAKHPGTAPLTPAPARACQINPLTPIPSPIQVSLRRIAEVRALAPRFTGDIWHAAQRAHVSPVLVAAIVHTETGHVPDPATVVSSAGAIGPMQLMPATAWGYLRVNPWIPSRNILGGARYIATLLHIFHGHLRLALAAYNVGPNRVLHWGTSISGAYYAHQVLSSIRFSRITAIKNEVRL